MHGINNIGLQYIGTILQYERIVHVLVSIHVLQYALGYDNNYNIVSGTDVITRIRTSIAKYQDKVA